MPYADNEKRRQHDREMRRLKRAGAVEEIGEPEEDNFFSVPELPECLSIGEVTRAVAMEVSRVRSAKAETLARARTVGYLAGILIRAIEMSSIESRLKALEDAILQKGDKR